MAPRERHGDIPAHRQATDHRLLDVDLVEEVGDHVRGPLDGEDFTSRSGLAELRQIRARTRNPAAAIWLPLSILIGFIILMLVVGAMMMTFTDYVESVLRQLAPGCEAPMAEGADQNDRGPLTRTDTKADRGGDQARRRGQEPGGFDLVRDRRRDAGARGLFEQHERQPEHDVSRADRQRAPDSGRRQGVARDLEPARLGGAGGGGRSIPAAGARRGGGRHGAARLVWSGESLKPKLSKISPLAGLKRLFSKQALANFVKGLIKLIVVGAVMVALLWPQRGRLDTLVTPTSLAR